MGGRLPRDYNPTQAKRREAIEIVADAFGLDADKYIHTTMSPSGIRDAVSKMVDRRRKDRGGKG